VLDNVHQQKQSLFFQRLPAELRLIIYSFVFLSQTVHIVAYAKHEYYIMRCLPRPVGGRWPELMGLLCRLEDMLSGCPPSLAPCFHPKRCHGFDISHDICRCQSLAIQTPVRACRLLYVESVSLLYANTSFAFHCARTFNVFCKAMSLNRQLAPPPLMFIRDIRICVLGPYRQLIRDTNAGLTLLTEQAVNLKRFELAAQHTNVYRGTRVSIWCGERRRQLKKTLRILGSFRGLESFNLCLMVPLLVKHLLDDNEVSVIAKILRELVSQPKGSGAMTARQFHNHFKTRYLALMATEEMA
jgi:hypothetical protein